jgi:hypothetical protein
MITAQIDGAEKQMLQKLCTANKMQAKAMIELLIYKEYKRSNKGTKQVE